MRSFISKIEDKYKDNPYHNKQHAATVTLTMFQILSHCGILDIEREEQIKDGNTKLYLLAAVLAAAVHDVNHPGVGNDFRIRTVSNFTWSLATHSRVTNKWIKPHPRLCKKETLRSSPAVVWIIWCTLAQLFVPSEDQIVCNIWLAIPASTFSVCFQSFNFVSNLHGRPTYFAIYVNAQYRLHNVVARLALKECDAFEADFLRMSKMASTI